MTEEQTNSNRVARLPKNDFIAVFGLVATSILVYLGAGFHSVWPGLIAIGGISLQIPSKWLFEKATARGKENE